MNRHRIIAPVIFVAPAILLAALIAGCLNRDHVNPFDPENPDTHGIPRIVMALAGNDTVDISWDLGVLTGIRSIDVQRRIGAGGDVTSIASDLPVTARTYTDAAVTNGESYQYRVLLATDSGGQLDTDWDTATPGPAVPFVADANGGGLARLTSDARHVLSRPGGGLWFLDVVADSVSRTIWAAEFLEGNLYEFDSRETLIQKISLQGARAVAVESTGLWAGSFDTGRVERRTLDGTLIMFSELGGHVEGLFSFIPSQAWAAMVDDAGTGSVRIYADNGGILTVQQIGGFQRPVAISRSGLRVFVLDRDAHQVIAYDTRGNPAGVESEPSALTEPTDMSSDGAGGIWVADPGRGALVHFDSNCAVVASVALSGVFGVTLDRGDVWVCGPFGAQIRNGDGSFVSGVSLGPQPVRVAVLHVD
jgi:hypothetical protein